MHFQACAYCTHPNPVGTNYCNHCGAALHLKPCRHCGAVAVAKASRCPACRREFPDRPTIKVDIPWAVAPSDPPVFDPNREIGAQSALSAPAAGPDNARLAATAQALAETQRLIEKASSRTLPTDHQPELVFPGHAAPGRHDRRVPGRGSNAGPDTATRLRAAALPSGDLFLTEESAGLEAPGIEEEVTGAATGSRYGPLIVLSLLGLVAAVALVYLLRYAGDSATGSAREIASPHRLLLPAASKPVAVPAAEEPESDGSTPVDLKPADEDALPESAPSPQPARQITPPPQVDPAAQASTLPAASECRPELRALSLCGKVNPTR